MRRLVLLAIGLVALVVGAGSGQEPAPIEMQLFVEPAVKGLGPLRPGQELELTAVVTARRTLISQIGFYANGRLIGAQLIQIFIAGTAAAQARWTTQPGLHRLEARLLQMARALTITVLSPQLQEGLDFAPGELLVKFKPAATLAQIQEITQRLGTEIVKVLALTEIYHLRIADGTPVTDKVAQFGREPLVEFAEPNGFWRFQQTPNDPRFPEQWHLKNTGQEHPTANRFLIFGGTGRGTPGADINIVRAWAQITDGSSVVIALPDSGIAQHLDLSENLLLTGARDFARHDHIPDDLLGHGTFVASIIAALGNNNRELTGILWRAKVWPLKLSESERFSWDIAIAALEHTLLQKRAGLAIRIINFSAGGREFSQSVKRTLDLVQQENLLFVTAAGNFGKDLEREPFYPCSYPHEVILCVAASNSRDELASWSSWGAQSVEVAAPGEDILGLLVSGEFLKLPRTRAISSEVAVAGGTSYAAAQATGLAALLWARCPAQSALEIRRLLVDSVEKRSSLAGKVASGGRLRWPESFAC